MTSDSTKRKRGRPPTGRETTPFPLRLPEAWIPRLERIAHGKHSTLGTMTMSELMRSYIEAGMLADEKEGGP